MPQPPETSMPATRTFGEGETQYTEVYQHLAGVPADLVEQVGRILEVRKATRRRATRREIYAEAVEQVLTAVRIGKDVEVLATAKVGKDVHFWLRDDLAEEFDQVCEKLNRRKNVVFGTALARWIGRSGEAPG